MTKKIGKLDFTLKNIPLIGIVILVMIDMIDIPRQVIDLTIGILVIWAIVDGIGRIIKGKRCNDGETVDSFL